MLRNIDLPEGSSAKLSSNFVAAVSKHMNEVNGSEISIEKAPSQSLDIKVNNMFDIEFAYLVAEVILFRIS